MFKKRKKIMKMIKLKLNKQFYPENAIKKTIEAYKDICDANFNEDNIILMPKIDVDEERLKHEFCNYCLSMVKE